MYNLSEEQRATLLYIFDHLIVTGPDQAALLSNAAVIVKGKKTYAQVPEKIKPQVKQVLIDLECEDLITEE